MRHCLVLMVLVGCGSVSAKTTDASGDGSGGQQDAMVDAPSCGGAGEACCASNTCSAGLTCTAGDQTCRASQLFIGASSSTTGMAYVARGAGSSFTVDAIGTGSVVSIWGTAANDVWAIGIYNEMGTNAQKSYASHWNGTMWEAALPFPAVGFVYALWGSAPNNYWAFTNGGSAYHWTGSTWGTAVPIDSNQVFGAAWGSSATNIWTFANNRMSHYDGAWTTSTRSDFSATRLSGVRASGELWAGGSDVGGSNPAVLHAVGDTITVEPLGTSNDCHQVVGIWPGQNEVWAMSSGLFMVGGCTVIPRLFHRTTSWTEVTGDTGMRSIGGMWGTSSKDIYVSGKTVGGAATVFHYDGTGWSGVYTPTTLTQLGPIWGVGSN